jgi:hypothetical protein
MKMVLCLMNLIMLKMTRQLYLSILVMVYSQEICFIS